MQTSLQIDGANCPTCFNETLEAIAALDGVRRVHGSIAGPCIEIDHDVPMETITAAIRTHLHGVEMFANEIRMVPLEPAPPSRGSEPRGRRRGARSLTRPTSGWVGER